MLTIHVRRAFLLQIHIHIQQFSFCIYIAKNAVAKEMWQIETLHIQFYDLLSLSKCEMCFQLFNYTIHQGLIMTDDGFVDELYNLKRISRSTVPSNMFSLPRAFVRLKVHDEGWKLEKCTSHDVINVKFRKLFSLLPRKLVQHTFNWDYINYFNYFAISKFERN